ncbi:hypothetical protein [Methylobacterium sp. JK268]
MVDPIGIGAGSIGPDLHLTDIFGDAVPTSISGMTVHAWTADQTGLYHTTTDLGVEWQAAYRAAQDPATARALTPIQHLEANAEAVIENTGADHLSADRLGQFREDVQREFDAIAAAMSENQHLYGIDPNAPLTEHTYLLLERTIQSTPALEELALQGHGLNNQGQSKYHGFTNDFQNRTDKETLFIGAGIDQNKNAIADFFDDVIMSHVPFPVVVHNGKLYQLNQNGDRENTLDQAVTALDEAMYFRTYTRADFGKTAVTATPYTSPAEAVIHDIAPAPAGSHEIVTLFGDTISDTITGVTPHDWIAGSDGVFHTRTDLGVEWRAAYAELLAGHGGTMTAVERLEANAEAVIENTGLSRLSAARQQLFREDAQREFDAIAAAMRIDAARYGIDPTKPFTDQTYERLERTIQTDPVLEELAMQGHGLNRPSNPRYAGFTTDFQNRVDNTTLYVGSGLDHGEKAIADFFDDVILSHVAFPVVVHNGKLSQLNQNGNREDGLDAAVRALNGPMFTQVLHASDFEHPAPKTQAASHPTATSSAPHA